MSESKNTVNKELTTNQVIGVLVVAGVGAAIYFGWPKISNYFETKTETTKTIVKQAPPQKLPVPQVMIDIASMELSNESELEKLVRLEKVVDKKSSILKTANEVGLEVSFDESEVPPTENYEHYPSAFTPVNVVQKAAPSFEKHTAKENDSATIEPVEIEPVVEIEPRVSPTLNLVRLAYDIKLDSKEVIVLSVGDAQWDITRSERYKDLKLSNLSKSTVCIESNFGGNACFDRKNAR